MHIFRHIFLSNYWWQRFDICSLSIFQLNSLPTSSQSVEHQGWDPPHFNRTKVPKRNLWNQTMKMKGMHLQYLKYQISAINSCWEKCDEKCAYMFNVYKNQLSRQTGSRNLTGPKTLPTIWHTYMKLVTKYQIPDSFFLFADFVDFYTHWPYMLIFRRIFLSNYWWQKSDIWSQASYTCRYPISTIWGTYMKLVTKYQISAINSCWEKCDEKCAYMFNVYTCRNQLSRQTGSRNLTDYYTPAPRRGRGEYCFTSVRLSVRLAILPSVQEIFRRIFLSNCWW
jgi:hypothetical protein